MLIITNNDCFFTLYHTDNKKTALRFRTVDNICDATLKNLFEDINTYSYLCLFLSSSLTLSGVTPLAASKTSI